MPAFSSMVKSGHTCHNGLLPSVVAGTDASHAQVVVHPCTRVAKRVHVGHNVSLALSVDTGTRVLGCQHCNAAFRGRVIRVNRITTVFSVRRAAISHLLGPPLYHMPPAHAWAPRPLVGVSM